MARRVHALDRDAAKLKGLAVLRRLGNTVTVLAADNFQLRDSQFLQLVYWSVVSSGYAMYSYDLPASCCHPHGPNG